MALPKVAKISHELVIPSTGKKVRFRPFLVKEEKVLILAQESQNQAEMGRAIKEVISACVQTKDFDVDSLATFDIEYAFLNIRGKSVSEDVEILVTCEDDGVTKVPVTVYLDDIKVVFDDEHTTDVKIDDTLSVRMKYPTLELAMESSDGEDIDLDQSLGLIAECIDMIYSDEESWSSADSTKEELIEWIGELEPKQFQAIEKFFSTMPKLSHKITVLNPKTGVKNDVVLEGMGSFFA